jgi:hypothetical protein
MIVCVVPCNVAHDAIKIIAQPLTNGGSAISRNPGAQQQSEATVEGKFSLVISQAARLSSIL